MRKIGIKTYEKWVEEYNFETGRSIKIEKADSDDIIKIWLNDYYYYLEFTSLFSYAVRSKIGLTKFINSIIEYTDKKLLWI